MPSDDFDTIWPGLSLFSLHRCDCVSKRYESL